MVYDIVTFFQFRIVRSQKSNSNGQLLLEEKGRQSNLTLLNLTQPS